MVVTGLVVSPYQYSRWRHSVVVIGLVVSGIRTVIDHSKIIVSNVREIYGTEMPCYEKVEIKPLRPVPM